MACRFLSTFLALFLLVPAVARSQSQTVTSQPGGQNGIDLPGLESQAISWLQSLIRINTSNPPGNDVAAAKYLQGVLKNEGIDAEIFESSPGRDFIVARLSATAVPNPSRALLLVGHLGTPPTDPSKWSVDPFGGTIQGDYLYGRGAVDDKSMTVANLAVLIALKRSNAHLDRDVIFFADSDSTGDDAGIRFALDSHWDKIAAGFAINNGGRVVLKDGKVQYVGVQVDEKVSRNLDVVATGTPGRSSLPDANNAVTHLAAAMQKIAAYETRPEFTFLTHDYFDALANVEDNETAKWMRALEDPSRQAHAVQKISEDDPVWGAMMRNTIAPTILQAGDHPNAIPAEARGVVNIRLLPGDMIEPLVAKLQQAVDDSQVQLQIEQNAPPPAPASSIESDLYSTISQVAKQQFPGAAVLPYMSVESTDSPFLRERSVQTYGLLPFALADKDVLDAAGPNERIDLDTFRKGVEFLYAIVTNFAAEK
ncbi:MAG TPA: M20/M25/M40 family metallo-hydrolase [Candidatus Acidoferrum sp.]|nr:M20/M25/M40 family metallo-hydrolase [Candidatus Acidoferrum sp.]